DLHRRERHVQFFGGQHRQRGVYALSHFAARHREHHAALARDLDPAVQPEFGFARRQQRRRAEPRSRGQHAPADDQRAGGAGSAQQQGAPFQTLAPAARLIAARTRWYVPQRQMLVIASSMSASVGLGFLSSSAAAAISMPLWQ